MRLGKQQKRILKRMKEESLVIRSVFDERDMATQIWLEDEDANNSYEKLTIAFFSSLYKYNLFTEESFRPCLQIHINTYRLKPDSS